MKTNFFSILVLFLIGFGYPAQTQHFNTYSGVYNYDRYGQEFGHNPFWARDHKYQPNTQMYIRNKLDYQIYRNPQLLTPVKNTNDHRYSNWLYPGHFSIFYRPRAISGYVDYSNLNR